MKIGIVTYHRSHNYGAMLQSVATRMLLEKKGYSVFYIDYWPEHQRRLYELFDGRLFMSLNLIEKFAYLKHFFVVIIPRMERRKNFNRFYDELIRPYVRPITDCFDIVLYGSDQIWRKQFFINQYNPFYFGDNSLLTKLHVAFAASMGGLPSNDIDKLTIKKNLKHLDYITVREECILNLVVELGYKDAKLILDPTLLLETYDWERMGAEKRLVGEKYVLLYDLLGDCFKKQYIEDFAKKNSLRVVEIVGSANSIQTDSIRTYAGPYEFLNLVKNADYVFTSSFHCLAFSLIFSCKFFAAFSRNAERATSLLKQVKLMNHLIDCNIEIPEYPEYDACEKENCINRIKEESLNIIDNILQECQDELTLSCKSAN